jgi:hypothetical protein
MLMGNKHGVVLGLWSSGAEGLPNIIGRGV